MKRPIKLKSFGLIMAACAAAHFAPLSAAAETIKPLPTALSQAQPLSLLPADPAAFQFSDTANKDMPGSFVLAGQLDGKALYRADVKKPSANYHGVNTRWLTAGAIRKGDVLLARYYARTLKARQESGEAEGNFFFQGTTGERLSNQSFSIGPDWTLINMPFVADRDYAAGEAQLGMNFGTLEQTFEVTALGLLNFGNRLALQDLPITQFSYAGREANAAWRKDALKRIEDIRTSPLIIKVVDSKGQPVKGAKIEAAMTRSAFLWGTSIGAERLVGVAEGKAASVPTEKFNQDTERYRQAVRELFDVTVVENGFKWPRWRQPEYRARAMKALDWLEAEGKVNKGHTLVWPGWKWTPKDIVDDPERGTKISGLVDAHIVDITTATKGRMAIWDVLNEPTHEKDYEKHMPREQAAEWFKLARKTDLNARLTINEYAMLNRSSSPLKIAEYRDYIQTLRKAGAPIDIIGVQGHVGQTPRPPVAVLSDLDLLAKEGLPIHVTEFDINTRDEALQADYTRDFLIAYYSHPATEGFIMWGFWESQHWKPAAAMYRADWTEKPNLKAWKDLVRGEWRTKVEQTTGADGQITAKGHHGFYKVKVSANGKTVETDAVLKKGSPDVIVVVK